ncbi:MAG: hypothetical protein GY774_25795 [Planctomycetes bacterium]|nr:hypothetical protein [Planctomycetota bacterium]
MFKRFVLILAALFLFQAGTVGAVEIIVITEYEDKDLDRLEDDQELIDWLVAEGHSVDVRRNNWMILDSQKIADLNAADLIIVSRLAKSGIYKHGEEPTQWNSVTTPLLLMNPYFARNIIWNWISSWKVTNDTPDIYAEVLDADHPVFRGVSLMPLDQSGRNGPANFVQVIDPLVGTGITSFFATTNMGNGRLIAKPVNLDMAWIAEWDAGVEFYEGAGQFAGGKRMLFCAGTQEIGNMCQGEFNLTADGRKMLHNAIAYLLGSANIILVTEEIDFDLDGIQDDHNLETFLASEKHLVDVRPNYWKNLDPNKIAELNAADLIIFSRSTNSAHYDDGDEKTQWNSATTPLLQMNAYFARNSRWEWVNYWNTTNDTAVVYLEAVEPSHPIFTDVSMIALDPENPDEPINKVSMVDPNTASGITSFIGRIDMGNGHLIARPVGFEMGWIAEWDAGVEFFEGAGEYTGGRRMLFSAGTQEIKFFDPETGEMIRTAYGELNLTAEGIQMFRNAIDYLLGLEFTESVVESVVEDFETNDFNYFPWSSYGDESWETTSSERHSGYYSARSGSIEDGEETSLEVRLECGSGYITFYCKVSCESDFDELIFYIDGLEQGKWSGQEDWAEVSFQVREGTRTFKWAYSKDSSISEGDDTAWIDDIVFPIRP